MSPRCHHYYAKQVSDDSRDSKNQVDLLQKATKSTVLSLPKPSKSRRFASKRVSKVPRPPKSRNKSFGQTVKSCQKLSFRDLNSSDGLAAGNVKFC